MSEAFKTHLVFVIGTPICTLAGLVFLGIGLWFSGYSMVVSTWPVADGTIVRSGAASKIKSPKLPLRGRSPQERSQVNIAYEYTVDGKAYQNDQIWPSNDNKMSVESANQVVKKYSKGTQVTVHYSSRDPQNAVLDPSIQASTWIALLGGVVFLVLGVLFGLRFKESLNFFLDKQNS